MSREWDEKNGTPTRTQFVYAGPMLVAKKTQTLGATPGTPETVWFHADHLTSTRLMTDASGAKVAHYDYAIFGEKTHESGTKAAANQKGFTSHEHDDELGLIYMKARYYDPVLGRFISPDSIIPEPGDPQSWNRYAYVRNNPFNAVDPTGHIFETPWDVANVAMDVYSLQSNLRSGSYGWAAVDAAGLAYDGVAAAVPVLPGGAGAVIKAAREGGEQIVKHADDIAEVTAKVTGKLDEAADAAKGAGNKIPDCELCAPPNQRGNAPIGSDGHPVEIHHRNQDPDGPLDEMTRTDHRVGDNFKKNHSNTGQEPTKIDRNAWRKEQKDYWKKEWDSGRFDGMKKDDGG